MWGEYGEQAVRGAAHMIGVLTEAESKLPQRLEDRYVRAYFGRLAMQAEFLAMIGDRVPGTSGEEVIEGIFGRVAETITYRPTMRRYPFVAYRLPRTFITMPREIRRIAAEVDPWWRARIDSLAGLDLAQSRAVMQDGLSTFDRAVLVQTVSVIGVMQPLFEALTKLIEKTGIGDPGKLGGTGGAEMAIVNGLWKASRGEASLDDVIRSHGFHGPLEGEVASRVWREDRTPLERAIESYAARDDGADPALRDLESKRELARLQREIIAAVPRAQRPGTKLLLRLAAERLPLRGYAKRAFLQAIDVTRGAARRMGEHLVEAGALDAVDDVFFFTKDELAAPSLPADARELAGRRRERRELFKTLAVPGAWQGELVPEVRSDAAADDTTTELSGIGASAGTVEGVVRVVMDAAFAEVEDDEILVAPTTDPSWSSIMFVSSALVVDIGSALSHAAVVARELGIPCVVNTRVGTSTLRTGDRVRVDGAAGTVEILQRAE
jgi:pyruvate,water dikinase